jgi:glutathione S-transferase
LLFGFDTAVIAGTTEQLSNVFHLTPWTLGLTVSIGLAGTILGALTSGVLGQKIGGREALRIMAIAVGGAEKAVAQLYETAFRPPEKRYRPWVERCHTQMHAALAELDRLCQVRGGEWLIGNRITQADVTATCVYTFLSEALDINRDAVMYPALSAVAARCEALPEFRSVKADWFAPTGS